MPLGARDPNGGGEDPVDELRAELFGRERDQELDEDGCHVMVPVSKGSPLSGPRAKVSS